MGRWWVPCLLGTLVLLLCSQQSRGLPADGLPVTGNPRGWQAAADAARTSVALTAQSVQHQRARMHERASVLAGKASVLTGKAVAKSAADVATAHAAKASPMEPPSVRSPSVGCDNQSLTARLPAAPLLLLIIAAAFSAGYAAGRGGQVRGLPELRELATAEMAALQPASPAAQCAVCSAHGSVSAAQLRPAANEPAGAEGVSRSGHDQHGSASAFALSPDAGAPLGAGASARDIYTRDSSDASVPRSEPPEASSDVDQSRAAATGQKQGSEALSSGRPAASSSRSCDVEPSRSASSGAQLPHPVSGLVFLSQAVSGCSDSLGRPSTGSNAGIDDVLAADATSAGPPLGCEDVGPSQEHTQQLAHTTQAECQRRTINSLVEESPLVARAAAEPPDDPGKVLSRTMRHSAADGLADTENLAKAGGATEQVCFSSW